MKKIILLVFLLLGSTYYADCQIFTYDAASSLGGHANGVGKLKMTKDPNGNVYMIGEFTGTRNFGAFSIFATGTSDVFVIKMDPNGVCQWAITLGGPSNTATAGDIVFNQGALYVVGTFSSSITAGAQTVNTTGQYDIFLTQLNPGNGAAIWLVKAGGNGDDTGVGICESYTGGVYITGNFTFSANFGAVNVFSGSFSNVDAYLAKYNSTGTCLWAVNGGSLTEEDKGIALKEFGNGHVAMVGYFQGTATFGSYVINGDTGTDIFVASYTSTGTVNWIKHGGGSGNDLPTGMSKDPNENIYITGVVGDTSFFDGFMVPDYGYGSVVTLKYDFFGGFLWAKWGGSQIGLDNGIDISTDAVGSSYVVGALESNAIFSGVPLNGAQGFDGFVAKYGTTGSLTWVTRIAAPGINDTRAVLNSGNGYCYIAGSFVAPFTLGTASFTPSGPTNTDPTIYFTRLGGGPVGINDPELTFSVNLFPVPANENITLTYANLGDAIASIDILDIRGAVVYSKPFPVTDPNGETTIDISSLSSGTYFARLNSSGGELTKSFVKE